MNLKDLLTLFIAFREQVVTRRTKFLLNKARDRAHVLVGLRHCGRQYRRDDPGDPHLADPNTAREP
jgi:DNA gyrase subunit A